MSTLAEVLGLATVEEAGPACSSSEQMQPLRKELLPEAAQGPTGAARQLETPAHSILSISLLE